MPKRYSTTYRTTGGGRWRASWWTWRGRLMRHRIKPA